MSGGAPAPPRHLIVMGVSGSGKSTLARGLAGRLGWAFAEGDDFHPPANVAKMRGGTPLTGEDRWPWLGQIRDWLTVQALEGRSSVVSCSALKRSYRDLLRGAEGEVLFIYLNAPHEVLQERLQRRRGHFMPAALLDSQLATLEVPQPDEQVLPLDVGSSTGQQVQKVLDWLAASCVAAS